VYTDDFVIKSKNKYNKNKRTIELDLNTK